MARKRNPKSLAFWLAFTGITLIAAFFRFYHLADHPLGLFFDPVINGLDAIRLMQRGGPVIFFPSNGGRESLMIYLLTPFIWLFGTTPFAFRLQLAVISLLNVVCLFGLLIANYKLQITNDKWRTANDEWRMANNQNPIPHSSFRQRHASAIHNSQFTIFLAALVLAVSPWHIAISRGDQRPLAVPLLAVLVFWFFLKAWSTGLNRWFILSGLFLGLGLYTYSAARLLPIILILALLPELFLRLSAKPPLGTPYISLLHRLTPHVSRPTHHALRPTPYISFLAPALLIAAPMLWYFFNHPAQFSARAASVMIWTYLDAPGDILAELGRNLVRVLGFFCCSGSPNAIFGLPGFPGLSLLLTPFLVIGLISALKNWRDFFSRLVALWWLIGITPSLIAIEAPHPLRMIVALPATAILVALGLEVVVQGLGAGGWISRLSAKPPLGTPHRLIVSSPHRLIASHLIAFILILATIPATFSAYFIEWPRLPVTQGIYDYGAVAIRDAILEQNSATKPIYLPLARLNDPPLLFYLSGTFKRQATLTAPLADTALAISPEENELDPVWVRLQGDTVTLLPPLTVEGQQLIRAALAGDSSRPIQTLRGETVARLAALPADPARFVQQPTHPLTAAFGPARLIGATYPATIDPTAAELLLTLYWQALNPMSDDYEVILQLVNDSRRVWGDGTARPNDWVYPTSFWRPGLDTIAAQQYIRLEQGGKETLSPGRYWLAVALYDPAADRRLPLTEGISDSPDTFFIGPLKVALPSPPPLPLLEGGEVKFGDMAQLSGFRLDTPTVAAGEPVQVNLLWQALRTPPVNYTVFVHLLDANNNLVAGSDAQPVNNTYPTILWSPGERILDPHTLPTPISLSPGLYRLAVGLYDQPSGERLSLHFPDGREDPLGQLILTSPVNVTLPK